jgi:hypothetical protein
VKQVLIELVQHSKTMRAGAANAPLALIGLAVRTKWLRDAAHNAIAGIQSLTAKLSLGCKTPRRTCMISLGGSATSAEILRSPNTIYWLVLLRLNMSSVARVRLYSRTIHLRETLRGPNRTSLRRFASRSFVQRDVLHRGVTGTLVSCLVRQLLCSQICQKNRTAYYLSVKIASSSERGAAIGWEIEAQCLQVGFSPAPAPPDHLCLAL